MAAKEAARAARPNLIVLFDGVCNLCCAAVKFIIAHDRRKQIYFSPLQSSAARRLAGSEHPKHGDMQIVFIEDGRHYTGSDAWVRIAKHLDGAWSLLHAFTAVPRPMREFTYRLIANNRYHWFGKRDSCELASRDAEERLIQ